MSKLYFSIWFFEKDDKYLFKSRNSCCVYGIWIFSIWIRIYRFFLKKNKIINYTYFYIRNLENSRSKSGFQFTISICICVGRKRILNGHYVVEKCLKCAVFKISDVSFLMQSQKSYFLPLFELILVNLIKCVCKILWCLRIINWIHDSFNFH